MVEDEIALLLDRLMRHAHAGFHQRAHLMDEEGLHPTDGMLLLTLGGIEPAPMHALVDIMVRHKSQVTRTVQKLEASGLIQRADLQSDGRVQMLRLTPKGQAMADHLRGVMSATLHDLLGPLSQAERESLRTLLERALNA